MKIELSNGQKCPPVKGINSMNRTDKDVFLVISTNSSTSESLSPLITTTFNLTDLRNGEANAMSRDRSTAS